METSNSEVTQLPPPKNSREVFANVLLIEPVYLNATYALNLSKENNPIFYALAQKVIASVESQKPTIKDVIEAINKHIPPVQEDMGTYRSKVKSAQEKPTVPIDLFYDSSNPAPYCLERSIFTQLVLANFGIESKLTNIVGISKSEIPHLNHIVLEVQIPQNRSWREKISRRSPTEAYFIESTSTGGKPARLYQKEFYLQQQSETYHHTKVAPEADFSVFAPIKTRSL